MWDLESVKPVLTAITGGLATYLGQRMYDHYKRRVATQEKAKAETIAIEIAKIKDSQFLVGVLMNKLGELEAAKDHVAADMLALAKDNLLLKDKYEAALDVIEDLRERLQKAGVSDADK